MMSNTEIEAAETETSRLSERPVGINPLLYPGWDFLVSAHPGSSFFHRTAWGRVLHETYGHLPIYFCRFADGQLKELFPIMEISSPWTGRRGVSLPFTDACLPLQTTKHDHRALYELALEHGRRRNWRSLECRSNHPEWQGASPSLAFYGHTIDLKHGREALFKSFEGAVRRGIRKAARTGLRVEFSNSLDSIRTFYALHCVTRRRHGLLLNRSGFLRTSPGTYWRRATGLSQLHAGRISRWPRGSSFTMAGRSSTSSAPPTMRFRGCDPTTLSSGKLSSDVSMTDLTPCIWAGHPLPTKVCDGLNLDSGPGRRESSIISTILSNRPLLRKSITALDGSIAYSAACRCQRFGSPVKCFTRICLSRV